MNLLPARKILTGTMLTVLLLSPFGTSVFAEEKSQSDSSNSVTNSINAEDKTIQSVQSNNDSKTLIQSTEKEESNDLTSTNDELRYKALEKEYNITLEEVDHWSVNYPDYTPMNILKQMGYYHINANRQTLIMYAISKDDWQPYRAFEAKYTPLYFEIVDGKFEYSKIYFGHAIENYIFNNGLMGINLEKPTSENEVHVKELKSYIEKFKAAPGIVPYVVGLNHREDVALQYGVERPKKDFFNSKYNNPKVMAEGRFE